jgi:hypothetical protein
MRDRVRLEDRLEDELTRVQTDLEKASKSFDSAVESLAGLLGSKDVARITAAKESMQLWSDAVRTLSEKERVIQRRLAYQTTRDLSRSATKAVRSASRAAWAAFWVTVLAMVAWSAATYMPTIVPVNR